MTGMIATDTEAQAAPVPDSPPRLWRVPQDKRRALVVGASSGMGAALVRQLASEGYRVAAIARRSDMLAELRAACAEDCARYGTEVFVHTHDVVDTAEVPGLFERIVRDLGGLDLVIYAAGIMPDTAPNEYDTENDLSQVTINLGGCIAWGNAAAQLFRTQRDGTLIGISSIAGDRGRKGNPVYCTTKAAMNTYLEALRNRLSEVGAHVCTIKPGFIATPMTENVDGMFWVISAEEAARTILSAGRQRIWNIRYVPLRWWAVGTVIRMIPSFLFRKLNI